MSRIISCDVCLKQTGFLFQTAVRSAYPERHEGWLESSGLTEDFGDRKFDTCSSECLLKLKNEQAVLEVKCHDMMTKNAAKQFKRETAKR